jgi:hypothetical protein
MFLPKPPPGLPPPQWLKFSIKNQTYWQNVTNVKKATDGLYVKEGLVPGSLHPMREQELGVEGCVAGADLGSGSGGGSGGSSSSSSGGSSDGGSGGGSKQHVETILVSAASLGESAASSDCCAPLAPHSPQPWLATPSTAGWTPALETSSA